MRDGLVARARGVDIGHLVRGKDRESRGGEAFRGYVHVFSGRGGGGGEEYGLFEGPFREVVVDLVVEFTHCDEMIGRVRKEWLRK